MLTLYVDAVAEQLVTGPNSTTKLSSITLGQGEIKPVAIVFLEPTGQANAPYSVVSIPAGFTQIIIAGAAQNALGTLLFSATEFEAQGEGDDLQYVGTLNLNTDPINALFPAVSQVPIYLDILLTDDEGDMWDDVVKFQSGNILQNLWAGEPAASAEAPYPPPASLVLISGMVDLPNADPHVNGTLWNNGGVLCVSAG